MCKLSKYFRHYSDLSWGLKAVRLLKSSVLCSCLTTTSQSSALRQTISILYGGQVLDLLDWTSIVALSERHLTTPNLTTQVRYLRNIKKEKSFPETVIV